METFAFHIKEHMRREEKENIAPPAEEDTSPSSSLVQALDNRSW